MTAREQLLQELAQVPDELVEEVLDFLLFAKSRRIVATSEMVEDEDDRPKEQILEQVQPLQANHADTEAQSLLRDFLAVSEASFSKIWLTPEEDEAWKNL